MYMALEILRSDVDFNNSQQGKIRKGTKARLEELLSSYDRVKPEGAGAGEEGDCVALVVDAIQLDTHQQQRWKAIGVESRKAETRKKNLRAKNIRVHTMEFDPRASNATSKNKNYESGDFIRFRKVERMRDTSKSFDDPDFISSPAGAIYDGWYTGLILFKLRSELVVLAIGSNQERGFDSLKPEEW